MIRPISKTPKHKTAANATKVPAGVKVVAPPKSARYRRLLEGSDITVSGGYRSVRKGRTA